MRGTSSDEEPTPDPAAVKAAAPRILASYERLFVDAYPLGPIFKDAYDPELFDWYDATGAALKARGYAELGDLKIVKNSAIPEPGAGPFARRFLSADGVTRVDIFQLQAHTGAFTRVINAVTELLGPADERSFLWTTTAPQRWNTPPHIAQHIAADSTSAEDLVALHGARLSEAQLATPAAQVIQMTTLDDVIASENRAQAASAAFRRAQQMPTLDELIRLNSAPALAAAVHAELRRIVNARAGAPAEAQESSWTVTTVDLPGGTPAAMADGAFAQHALQQGIAQVKAAGSPLHPFLLLDTGRAFFFMWTAGPADPMQIALRTLKTEGASANACALVFDSRIVWAEGKKRDAIVAMVARRDDVDGQTWAQCYRPKGWLRAFATVDDATQVATSRNLFAAATES